MNAYSKIIPAYKLLFYLIDLGCFWFVDLLSSLFCIKAAYINWYKVFRKFLTSLDNAMVSVYAKTCI